MRLLVEGHGHPYQVELLAREVCTVQAEESGENVASGLAYPVPFIRNGTLPVLAHCPEEATDIIWVGP